MLKPPDQKPYPELDYNRQAASDLIKDMLSSNNSCMRKLLDMCRYLV